MTQAFETVDIAEPRLINEQGGHEYMNPFSQAAKDTWYRITAFVVYALIAAYFAAGPSARALRPHHDETRAHDTLLDDLPRDGE